MSKDEWVRLAQADTRTLPHIRAKGPVSTPAQRLIELNSQLQRTQVALGESLSEISKLETKLKRFTEFGGVSFGGVVMAQIWADMIVWELLLNVRKFKAIFELGSYEGGFSWWLWAQTQARGGMKFFTYDAVVPSHPTPCFEKRDIFADAERLGELMRAYEPCVVFCDNGNKPREMAIFSKELRSSESVLVVHDWGTEFLPEDVPDGVEMIYREFCEEIDSMSRLFKLKGEHEQQG